MKRPHLRRDAVLCILADGQPHTVADLADIFNVTAATIRVRLHRLRRQGHQIVLVTEPAHAYVLAASDKRPVSLSA